MTDEGEPYVPAQGTWVVPAPPIGEGGKPPAHRRSPYPASAVVPSVSGPVAQRAPGPPAGQPVEAEADPEGATKRAKRRSARSQRLRNWAETVAVFAVGLVLALVLRAFLLQAFSIPSASMVPTLVSGDRVVVWKPSDSISDLKRGDVIVFERPDVAECPFSADDPEDLIKRVVGLPGEVISSPTGQVLADGVPIDESYLPDGVSTDMAEPITVPDGRLLMLGDNRGASKDGRCFGPISEDAIVGRATARVWPPGRIGGL